MRSELKSQNSSSMEKIPKTPTYQQRLKVAQETWVHLKPPWHPHLPGQEVAVPEAKNIAGDNMSPEENYGFAVKGFLIVRNVLNKSELMECNNLIDQGKMPLGLCANPILLRYIEQLCGLAYRLDKPLKMLEQLETHEFRPLKGGDEPRNPSRGYFHQGTSRFCQGVRAIWALADVPNQAGGLLLLPCSHTVNVPVPDCIRNGEDAYLKSIGMSLQPVLQAGDLLLHASTIAHGLQPWIHKGNQQRLASCEFISVYARPSDFSSDSVTEGGRVKELPWMKQLNQEERVILGLSDTNKDLAPPLLSNGHRNRIGTEFQKQDNPYHPGLYEEKIADLDEVDPLEFFYWELTGFLVVRKVMDPDWIAEANAVINANQNRIDYEGASQHWIDGSSKMRGTGRPSLSIIDLPDEERKPFQRMLAHPALVHRLNWMLGGHFRAEGLGSIIATRKGGGGQILHGNGAPIYPNINWWPYLYRNGRCHTGQVNVAWQLHDVTQEEGGFVVVPGSHHARFPLPSNDSGDPAGHKGLVHPLMQAGDLLFFMGGATTHGAWSWNSDVDRRCVLNAYWSKDIARLSWVNKTNATNNVELIEGLLDAEE